MWQTGMTDVMISEDWYIIPVSPARPWLNCQLSASLRSKEGSSEKEYEILHRVSQLRSLRPSPTENKLDLSRSKTGQSWRCWKEGGFTLTTYSPYVVGALVLLQMEVASPVSEGRCCRTEKPAEILTLLCAGKIRLENGGGLKARTKFRSRHLPNLEV